MLSIFRVKKFGKVVTIEGLIVWSKLTLQHKSKYILFVLR